MRQFIKIFLIIIYFLSVDISLCQCYLNENKLVNIRPDSTLNLPLLEIKNPNVKPVLDKAIKFVKKYNFKKDSIWLYFQIDILSAHDSIPFIIKLRQGDGSFGFWNICNEFNGCTYYGAFCYKGYTFFVHYDKQVIQACKDIFNILLPNERFYLYEINYQFVQDGTLNKRTYGISYWLYNNEFFYRGKWKYQ